MDSNFKINYKFLLKINKVTHSDAQIKKKRDQKIEEKDLNILFFHLIKINLGKKVTQKIFKSKHNPNDKTF